jgi:MoxR-like ATPase
MNLNEAAAMLDRAIGLKLPLMLWGPPGVGKSAIVAAVAAARKLPLEDLRLAQLDAADLRGIPVPDREKRRVDWFAPSFLPRDGRGLLFLDEIDKAPSLVKNAALQLVLDRKLGDYRLPDGWALACAGNREEDNAFSSPLGAALANRLLHVEIDADLDTWTAWAGGNGVNEDIVAFLKFRPELLYKQTGENAFPSPRSWEAASRLLACKDSAVIPLAAAAVGASAASEFAAWSKLYRTVKVDDVLDGKLPKFSDKDASLRYAVVLAVAARIVRSGITEPQTAGLAALLEAVTPELRVLLFKSLPAEIVAQLSAHPALRKTAAKLVLDYVGG